MTKDEIHNIYLHMSGKAEGLAEASGSADFPVMFAEAILAYAQPSEPHNFCPRCDPKTERTK
jgi:hypothetical protein